MIKEKSKQTARGSIECMLEFLSRKRISGNKEDKSPNFWDVFVMGIFPL